MSSRKKRRLEETGLRDHGSLKKYTDGVRDGEIEGVFGNNVFTDDWHPHDPQIKKYRDRGSFELQPLLLDNMETGWVRCTLPLCKERMLSRKNERIFQAQQNNRDGLLKKNVLRYFELHHLTEEEESAKRQAERQRRIDARRPASSADPDQPSIELFAQPTKKKFGPQVVEELKKMNAAVIAEAGLSLDFWTKSAVIEREKYLLESMGYDSEQVHRFDRGSSAVKADLYKVATKNANAIKKVLPQLADKSRIALMVDHQAILQLTNEPNRDALGSALILSAIDDKRYSYLMGFESVSTTSTSETVRIVRRTAQAI